MTGKKPSGALRPARGGSVRTPFQIELIRLIDGIRKTSERRPAGRFPHASEVEQPPLADPESTVTPSGAAILDIARELGLTHDETEGLILKAIETKGRTRSRDSFWIQQVGEMVARRDAEIAAALRFLDERGTPYGFFGLAGFGCWRAPGGSRGCQQGEFLTPKTPAAPSPEMA